MALSKLRVCILLLFAAQTGRGLGADTGFSSEKAAKLQKFIEGLIDCQKYVGMSVALVKDGNTVFVQSFGDRDREKGLPMENNTRISIASISKGFTATLVAHAVSKEQLKWEQPLREILGKDFRLMDKFRTEKATIRDLLAHTMGIPGFVGASTGIINATREELCMKKLQHFPTNYDFRSKFEYSNYPFVLAGYVTEKLRGKTWEDDVTETLFKALGMSDTKVGPHLKAADWENTAYSHSLQDGKMVKNPEEDILPTINNICPAGCIFSTPNDMAKWMKFHLSGGKNEEGKQVVPTKILSELYKPVSAVYAPFLETTPPTYPAEDTISSYGQGFMLGRYRGFLKVFHPGSYSSYHCLLTLLPDQSAGVWICLNSPDSHGSAAATKLVSQFALDLLMDVEPWLTMSTACTFPAPWVNSTQMHEQPNGTDTNTNGTDWQRPNATDTAQQRPLTDYAGDYEHLAFGNFTVYVQGDSLRYKYGLLLRGPLEPSETRDNFYMKLEHPYIYVKYLSPIFRRGFPVYFSESGRNAGKVDEVKVPFIEFAINPVFKKGHKETTDSTGAVSMSKASLTAISLAVLIAAFSFL